MSAFITHWGRTDVRPRAALISAILMQAILPKGRQGHLLADSDLNAGRASGVEPAP